METRFQLSDESQSYGFLPPAPAALLPACCFLFGAGVALAPSCWPSAGTPDEEEEEDVTRLAADALLFLDAAEEEEDVAVAAGDEALPAPVDDVEFGCWPVLDVDDCWSLAA